MALVVQKFGGSSVATPERIQNVARIIAETYLSGHNLVVVLSAMGDTTDDLIELAQKINPNGSKREMDMLLSTGEQISVSLCAMAIEQMGLPVISLTGWQAGLQTNSAYGNARIKRLTGERISKELDKRRIVLLAGFPGHQQVRRHHDARTGRIRHTAVAVAASLHAELCQIYTDVDGVYTADPRLVRVPAA
jgi:aspartate kinase